MLMEKLCSKWGAGFVWGISNILMALCFLGMLVITYVAKSYSYAGHALPPDGIVIAALLLFTILGIPLAVSHAVLSSKRNSGFLFFSPTHSYSDEGRIGVKLLFCVHYEFMPSWHTHAEGL